MPRSWSRCWIRSTMRSTSSLPMEPVMAIQPTTQFSVTAQAQGSSFHRARTRLNGPTSKHPARETTTSSMQADGRLKWQTSTGYGKRALIETAMGRYKGIIGPRLHARSFRSQQTEAAIGVTILNRMLACGRPKSVRCEAPTAATK